MTANCVVRHKTNALSNSTRGLLSGMGAPSNIPLSGRLGKKPKDSVAIARDLSNFFSTPPKIKVEETPLTHCVASSETCNPFPSKDEHPAISTSCGFSRNATHPDVRVVTVHTPLHTSGLPARRPVPARWRTILRPLPIGFILPQPVPRVSKEARRPISSSDLRFKSSCGFHKKA